MISRFIGRREEKQILRPPRRIQGDMSRRCGSGARHSEESASARGQGPRYSTSSKPLRFLRRISAMIAWPRMAGIADFRLTRRGGPIESGGSRHATFSIDNRQREPAFRSRPQAAL
jgi:hypothetical protein